MVNVILIAIVTVSMLTLCSMFIPVGVDSQNIMIYRKDESGDVKEETFLGVRVSFSR
jgi:hypothetical protein